MREVVEVGTWIYGGSVEKPIYVVRLDRDFWYEIGKADGTLDPDEIPELNEQGFLYYVCFKSDPKEDPGWVDSIGHATADEAKAWAETKVPSAIEWK